MLHYQICFMYYQICCIIKFVACTIKYVSFVILFQFNVQKMRKTIINVALFALCSVCSAGLFGCDSVNRLSDFADNVRPSAHFSTIEFRLHGDTLHYYRVRYPQSLGR